MTSSKEESTAKIAPSASESASSTTVAAAAAATGGGGGEGATVARAVGSSSQHHQHKAPEETAQMSVLGMNDTDGVKMPPPAPPQSTPDCVDDGDRKMPATTTSSQRSRTNSNSNNDKSNGISSPPGSPRQTTRVNNAQKKVSGVRNNNQRKPSAAVVNKSWWDKILWGGKKDELGRTTNYTSLESPTAGGIAAAISPAAAETPGGRIVSTNTAAAMAARSHPPPRLEGFEDEPSTSNSSTVEDQVRQDCSFFYQGVEDPIQQKRGAAFPIPSSTSGTSLDRVPSRVLSSREGAIFHAKYQKLNRVIHVNDDLELAVEDPDDVESQPPLSDNDSSRNISISDMQNSTLIYKLNGRVQMRLPRDQTRLIMDPDLEPGILSVEQWRCGVDANEILPDGNAAATKGPPLRYVMTVPDDLYRRLVSEMSYGLDPPYAGFFKCCHDTETHADIRLALIIIAVVLFLLFIGTMDYRTT